ncbi:MAG: RimK family alpha-L-glutamate ligase [Methanothrix sp.]|nr:RimK family alpha-L-glutamate ligase [Methanothrix sp.]MCX8207341.1 RimK family alpha-L-glutamate ligase [Methanothrix sp.]
MSRLGIFVNRQTLSSSEQLTALIKCRDAAESMGHTAEFIFPVDINRIPKLDALFIRANTDPMNATYVASRIASLYGIPVIDDPASIQICSDKINMYLHLMKKKLPIPRTVFPSKREIVPEYARALFERLGTPLVLKEPSTSFSARVEKASNVQEFMRIAKRFLRLSDWIVVQEYVPSSFDWRIGVLNGEFLYACRYVIPAQTFKIQASVNGHLVYCGVESVPPEDVPAEIIDLGIEAGKAIGRGLYGVDIKESNGRLYVIEVNDNPSLDGGEDVCYPDVYRRIISYLINGDQYAETLSYMPSGMHSYMRDARFDPSTQNVLGSEEPLAYRIDFER